MNTTKNIGIISTDSDNQLPVRKYVVKTANAWLYKFMATVPGNLYSGDFVKFKQIPIGTIVSSTENDLRSPNSFLWLTDQDVCIKASDLDFYVEPEVPQQEKKSAETPAAMIITAICIGVAVIGIAAVSAFRK